MIYKEVYNKKPKVLKLMCTSMRKAFHSKQLKCLKNFCDFCG